MRAPSAPDSIESECSFESPLKELGFERSKGERAGSGRGGQENLEFPPPEQNQTMADEPRPLGRRPRIRQCVPRTPSAPPRSYARVARVPSRSSNVMHVK